MYIIADQKLVAIHHDSFLVEQLTYLIEQTCNCRTKLFLWYILTTFPHKHVSFALSDDVFKKIYQKLKSLNVHEM